MILLKNSVGLFKRMKLLNLLIQTNNEIVLRINISIERMSTHGFFNFELYIYLLLENLMDKRKKKKDKLNRYKNKLIRRSSNPDNSSAGRAEDCRVWRLSLGRWFNSSLSEFLFLSIILIFLYF